VLLAACCVWLVGAALVDRYVAPGVPGAWAYAAPVLVAALHLPPWHVTILGVVAAFLYLVAVSGQGAPIGVVVSYAIGLALLAGTAVLWSRRQQRA